MAAPPLPRPEADPGGYTGNETANGFDVGLAEPPAGSTVTATTAPLGTVLAIGTYVAPRPPRKSPAGCALAPRTTHAS